MSDSGHRRYFRTNFYMLLFFFAKQATVLCLAQASEHFGTHTATFVNGNVLGVLQVGVYMYVLCAPAANALR